MQPVVSNFDHMEPPVSNNRDLQAQFMFEDSKSAQTRETRRPGDAEPLTRKPGPGLMAPAGQPPEA